MELTKAEQVIFELAEEIAENIISKQNFVISDMKYDSSDRDEIIRLLLEIEEIENVIPCEDGLMVFIY